MRPTPVVDVARVREVTRGQAGLLRQFTRLLEVTLSESMPALSSPDPKVRRRAAHRLKGACANMGAASLTALFTTLETDPGLPAHETLDRVEQTREETVHALEALAQLLEAPGI